MNSFYPPAILGRITISEPSWILSFKEAFFPELEKTLNLSSQPVSVNASLNDDNNSLIIDVLKNENAKSPDQELMDDSLVQELKLVLKSLGDRERKVMG